MSGAFKNSEHASRENCVGREALHAQCDVLVRHFLCLSLAAGALLCAPGLLAETHRLPLFVPTTGAGGQGVLRVLNLSAWPGTLEIHAINDSGVRLGPATLTLDALAAVDLDAADLAGGNSGKALGGGVGALSETVRLEVDTELSIQLLALLRSPDGLLHPVHDAIWSLPSADDDYRYLVPIFSAAQNTVEESHLRLVNPNQTPAKVSINARDDTGTAAIGGSVELTLAAGGTTTLTAQQLEAGDAGLTGMLGAGSGRWVLRVTSDQSIQVVSLVRSPTGALHNLSTVGLEGTAPADQAAFAERLGHEPISTVSGSRMARFDIETGNRFTELVEAEGIRRSRAGDLAYRRTGPHAGRLALDYDDGDQCVNHFYFASEVGGWFASRCAMADEPDGDWQGGRWWFSDIAPPAVDTSPRFTADLPSNQRLRVGEAITALILPIATGGNGMLTYALAPSPPGLSFDAVERRLAGVPSMVGDYAVTYTVTDADGDSDSLTFRIQVHDADLGTCVLGLLLRPGDACTYPGRSDMFSVDEDGRGHFLIVSSTRAINIPNRVYQGQLYDFRAEHRGDGLWRIDRLEGVKAPPPDTAPTFAPMVEPGDHSLVAGQAIAVLTLPAAEGGNGDLTYSLAPDVPGLGFDARTRQLSGTPSQPGTHAMTYSVADEDGDTDILPFTIRVREPEPPDLVVESLSVSNTEPTAGTSLTLDATLRNRGEAESSATTLRFFSSTDSEVTASDREIGSDRVAGLPGSGTSSQSIRLAAPSAEGTYFLGACVDAVADEGDTENNCATSVQVTVVPAPDLVVESVSASQRTATTNSFFTLSARVRNQGSAPSAATTLRYYRSSDESIADDDLQVGTGSVADLEASDRSVSSLSLRLPSNPGTNYYGACVDSVGGEADTANNCSGPAMVTVTRPAPPVVVEPPFGGAGTTFTDSLSSGGTTPLMVVIPAGSFRMGCLNPGNCTSNELPVHDVNIPRFALSMYEVTFDEWDACVDAGGCRYRPDDRGWGRGNRPVIRVDFDSAAEYVAWLSRETGKQYRFPTEAEWEYAARAGTETRYHWGNEVGTNRANCDGCGSQWDHQTAPVGSFGGNAWGLRDIHGNVLEWTADCINSDYRGAPTDGSAWLSGRCTSRVLRGGAWDSTPRFSRSAFRASGDIRLTTDVIGLRVARTLR